MADNFLERQYEDYLAQRAKKEQARRLAWQKQLKAYKAKLAAEKAQPRIARPTKNAPLP